MKEFKLDDHPKIPTGFKVPDGYFDGLTQQVMQRLDVEEIKVFPLYSKQKNWLIAAAAVLVLCLTIPVINNVVLQEEPEQAAIENYFAYHAIIADDDIVELLEDEDIKKIEVDYNLEDQSIEAALPADLENYIIN